MSEIARLQCIGHVVTGILAELNNVVTDCTATVELSPSVLPERVSPQKADRLLAIQANMQKKLSPTEVEEGLIRTQHSYLVDAKL